MRKRVIELACLFFITGCAQSGGDTPDVVPQLAGFEKHDGFFDMYWDAGTGRLILQIEQFEQPFIYQSSLARGIGSNDIGLDRGQLGATRLVEFSRSGPRVLMIQHNLDYRANTDSPDEQRAVDQSFARSVVWGFDVLGESDGAVYVDVTGFATRDAQHIAAALGDLEEGEYAVDAERSAVYLPRTRAFPDNSEMEAIVTFAGVPAGELLATVVPDPTSITVHLHHAFIRLPDDNYDILPFDPRAGVIGLAYESDGFIDYASPIGSPLKTELGRRHRLVKRDPAAKTSVAVEPIVYYVDRGAPEPVRAALIEGASWWNLAFEAAGFTDAFRVELLPEGVDPMDVRYNVIQWVHRSTRGWSYGYSVLDPRTGEIMKGHVTLGSLRVRQDYLIAEGLTAPYKDEAVPGELLEMSLARIRQLSAHEVGHTLGIEHNFAASTQDRASVMDYPFPLVRFDEQGELDLSDAYGHGIGEWDKRVVTYMYGSAENRNAVLAETVANYKFVADQDARGTGTPHPDGNLWDNGEDALEELRHLMRVREHALQRFSENNIRFGRPHATLEEVLVPVYLLHRFQIRAVSKLIGGQYFNYSLRGDGQEITGPVVADRQHAAMRELIGLLDSALLKVPDRVVAQLPPRPPGFSRTRETFPNTTGRSFDPVGPAESAVTLTLAALLDPARAARMNIQHAGDPSFPGFAELCDALLAATWQAPRRNEIHGLIQRRTNILVLHGLMRLSVDPAASAEVKAIASDTIGAMDSWLSARTVREPDREWRSLFTNARLQISRFIRDPAYLESIPPVVVPPGSPIGDNSIY